MAVDQRNFGNVLDINGTEVNVEDKRLAELAGQTPKSSSQISTSSQYVPLQDTDGNIVKISPASFQEAVRNTLASLLVNNDKGTSFSQVPVIGSGDFGSASLANLASVLREAGYSNKTVAAGTSERLDFTNYEAVHIWVSVGNASSFIVLFSFDSVQTYGFIQTQYISVEKGTNGRGFNVKNNSNNSITVFYKPL